MLNKFKWYRRYIIGGYWVMWEWKWHKVNKLMYLHFIGDRHANGGLNGSLIEHWT